MERIKMEDGEGVEIVDEISFLYIGEIKPIIISLSTRSKKELAPLYGREVRHYPESDMLALTRCLKKNVCVEAKHGPISIFLLYVKYP